MTASFKTALKWHFLAVFCLYYTMTSVHAAPIDIAAHRGDPRNHVENTLPAFGSAIRSGATSVEFDVLPTRDMVPVLHHDFHVTPERFLNLSKTKDLREMSLDEIKTLRFSEPKAGETTIPTLEEFFEYLRTENDPRARSVVLHLELKHEGSSVDREKFLDTVLAIIRKYKLPNRIMLRSFDWPLMELALEKAPELGRVLLADKFPHPTFFKLKFGDPVSILFRYSPDYIAPHFSYVDEKMVNRWRPYGIRIHPYTVNSFHIAAWLIRIGVIGFATDIPERMAKRFLDVPKDSCQAMVTE